MACYLGLISGTSVDAVDAALLEFDHGIALVAAHAEPPPAGLREQLLRVSQRGAAASLVQLGELDQRVGAWFADAARHLLHTAGVAPEAVRAIGSHGQTLYHHPHPPHPFSLQIGDPTRIACATGITTVADLRRADMAAGGQGAPLVPGFHQALLASDRAYRCVLNIGGIANVTLLPPSGTVTGFDTGPGNALLDAWISAQRGQPYDEAGSWAASGKLDHGLLHELLADPYFARPPPKSTGRESFNLDWLHRASGNIDSLDPADVQRSLLELSARTIADAIEAHGPGAEEVILCGGGARNSALRARLQALLAPRRVTDTNDYGIAPDWIEASAMAWLAMRAMAGLPGNLPSVTGAREAVVLGGIYAPRVKRKD